MKCFQNAACLLPPTLCNLRVKVVTSAKPIPWHIGSTPGTYFSTQKRFFGSKNNTTHPLGRKRGSKNPVSVTGRVDSVEHGIDISGSCETSEQQYERLFSKEQLIKNLLKKSDSEIDYGKIYQSFPNRSRDFVGKHGVRRIAWEEHDCSETFPSSPERANLSVLHYLEQRDMWERRQVLHIPKFCIGSIVSVTRGDPWSEDGWSRFVGICIRINWCNNTKGHLFTLRNVILGDALEINYPFYNPLIQKIEVLRHERWENEIPGIGLRFLRDYPKELSTVDEKMEAEPYTEEPIMRKWTDADREMCRKHFEDIFHSRSRNKVFDELPLLHVRGLKHV